MTTCTTDEYLREDIGKNSMSKASWGPCAKAFYTVRSDTITSVESDAAILASRTGEGLDSLAILEEVALGFQLGSRTLFSSVKRLLPWERIVSRDGGPVIESEPVGDPPPSILDFLSDQVGKAFVDGVALELTGGLDSRLLLAVGLRNGTKPKLAFTIGDETTPDVMAASALAGQYGFPHLTIPLVIDQDRIKQDTIDFIRAAGYAVNAACYAWLPATLSALDGKRTAQMSGNGGEIAGSFYYTPFDFLIEPLRLESQWVKMRLLRPWIDQKRIWAHGTYTQLSAALSSEAHASINKTRGTWRERVDDFYTNERIRGWALPVLDASNTYYKVVAPLLAPEYYAWALSLPVAERVNRNAQRELLRRAHPQLASFQLQGKVTPSNSPVTLTRKVLSRLLTRKRVSALGIVRSAIALAQDRDLRDYVQALAQESDAGFAPTSIQYVLDHPGEHPELLGTLVTAAIAWHDLKNCKSRPTGNGK